MGKRRRSSKRATGGAHNDDEDGDGGSSSGVTGHTADDELRSMMVVEVDNEDDLDEESDGEGGFVTRSDPGSRIGADEDDEEDLDDGDDDEEGSDEDGYDESGSFGMQLLNHLARKSSAALFGNKKKKKKSSKSGEEGGEASESKASKAWSQMMSLGSGLAAGATVVAGSSSGRAKHLETLLRREGEYLPSNVHTTLQAVLEEEKRRAEKEQADRYGIDKLIPRLLDMKARTLARL